METWSWAFPLLPGAGAPEVGGCGVSEGRVTFTQPLPIFRPPWPLTCLTWPRPQWLPWCPALPCGWSDLPGPARAEAGRQSRARLDASAAFLASLFTGSSEGGDFVSSCLPTHPSREGWTAAWRRLRIPAPSQPWLPRGVVVEKPERGPEARPEVHNRRMEVRTSSITAANPTRRPRQLLRAASDERLVAHLRRGDPAAFGVIYDRHHRQILSFCRHLLGSREDGEDAALQTFSAAHDALVGSSKRIELRPWLYTIARNRCVSVLRARRETSSLDDPRSPPARAAAADGLDAVVARREDLRRLVEDLGQLPEQQRGALVLFELGDLSHREIARVLGCEAKQVKALVFQARTNLVSERDAREVNCAAIREELAVARGSALSRGRLRRHIRSCPACSEFAAKVRRQRADLALVLPVIPTASLKSSTFAAVFGAHSAAGGASSLGGASLAAGGISAKIATAVALLVAGASAAVIHDVDREAHHRPTPARAFQRNPSSVGASRAIVVRPRKRDSGTVARGVPVSQAFKPSAAPAATTGIINPAVSGVALGRAIARQRVPPRTQPTTRRAHVHSTSRHSASTPTHAHHPPQARHSGGGAPGVGKVHPPTPHGGLSGASPNGPPGPSARGGPGKSH